MNGIIEEEEMEDEGSDGEEEDLTWKLITDSIFKFSIIIIDTLLW
jgi:hypothetical protein